MSSPSLTYAKAIDASHPCCQTDGSPEENLALEADWLAMKLVGERHEKRALVNLVRWLIMRKPEGLLNVEAPAVPLRPLPAGTVISYDGLLATVEKDEGGESLLVTTEGDRYTQRWLWQLDGITCKVVSLPSATRQP